MSETYIEETAEAAATVASRLRIDRREFMQFCAATATTLGLSTGAEAAIAKAVEKICREYSQPLRVEDMARQIGMSVSGFHHHFKAVTAMSPLQFQKNLRLQQARRCRSRSALAATRRRRACWQRRQQQPGARQITASKRGAGAIGLCGAEDEFDRL